MKRLIKVQFKRRRESKTDYKARARALAAGIPRLVARKTNRYLIAQIVESKNAQDYAKLTVNSKELIHYGWPSCYSIKNLGAAYLVGFLCACKAKKAKVEKAVFDIGLARSTAGSKIYGILKGAFDGGLKISHGEKVLPSMEKIKSTKVDIDKVKEEIINKFK